MKSDSRALFAFIAALVARANPPAGSSLGFTFSFPVNQTSIKSGALITWTKGCVCWCRRCCVVYEWWDGM
jgi:hexokinase